jgi:ribosomal protein S18 acetylase RimI-like enzyme
VSLHVLAVAVGLLWEVPTAYGYGESWFAEDVGVEGMVEGNAMGPAQTTNVRPATAADLSAAAELHANAIGEGFLATLGAPFLRRLYGRVVTSSHGFLLVADDPDSGTAPVSGFVAGSGSLRGLYREFVLRDGLTAVALSRTRLVRAAPRAFETLRYGTRSDVLAAAPPLETELLSLAVLDSARRSGIGTALVAAFKSEAASRGFRSARVVVGVANEPAIGLYRRSGFAEAGRFELHAGAVSLLMRADLTDVSRP